tara:strand:- start:1328 stop:2035 length:708 start_codon:yes stop_codon:yes gene_type:complete
MNEAIQSSLENFIASNNNDILLFENVVCAKTTSCKAFKGLNLFVNTYELQLLKTILPFFLKDGYRNLKLMIELRGKKVSGRRSKKKNTTQSKPSLRSLDWLFTNYSKDHLILINNVNVCDMYTKMLAKYSKKLFDMFRRNKAILLRLSYQENNAYIITNVAQLNFFKWYIEMEIFIFVHKYLTNIQSHMSTSLKLQRKKTKRLFPAQKSKRKKLLSRRSSILNNSKLKTYVIMHD